MLKLVLCHKPAALVRVLQPQLQLRELAEAGLWRCNASFAAFYHPLRHSSPLAEFDAVLQRAARPGQNATREVAALVRQRRAYEADASFMEAERAGRNRMIDGSVLMYRLGSDAAQQV